MQATTQTVIYQVTKDDLENLLQDAINRALNTAPPAEKNTPDPDKLFTDAELQRRAKVSRFKLWQDRKAGKLPFIRIGNMIRYRESDIQEYLHYHINKPT